MPQSQGETPASMAETLAPARRPLRPRPMRNESLDPISHRKRRPLLRPANILFFAGMAVFGLYAQGHLPELDHFFDSAQAFGRAHNDAVVGAILHGLPALLVFSAATVLTIDSFAALRNRRRSRSIPAVRQSTKTPEAANAFQVAPAERPGTTGFEPEAAPRAQIMPTPILEVAEKTEVEEEAEVAEKADVVAKAQPGKPVLVTKSVATEEASLRHAEGQAKAPAEPVAVGAPARVQRHISESVPTLPAHPRVRRPSPRGTLSPAVIATLKMEVAKRTLTR